MFTQIGLVALSVVALLPSGAIPTQPERTRCFAETGYCVSGQILDYWERNGGLPVFGYPTTAEMPNENVENSFVGRTQWFERDRLEIHYDGVKAGRLGARMLSLQGRPWESLIPANGPAANCDYFEVTRHSMCEPFRSYWKKNGGLERFGYPISEPMTETINGWTGTVQYFERRRMEHHTELAGTKYEVLLGLLGNETKSIAPPILCNTALDPVISSAVRNNSWLSEQFGCPLPAAKAVPAAYQQFQLGEMTWFNAPGIGTKILVGYRLQQAPSFIARWTEHLDTWKEGEPEDIGVTAPSGLYAPRRGFGKLWANNETVRGIGWGLAPEAQKQATVQQFSSGSYLINFTNEPATFYYTPTMGAGILP